MKKTPLSYFRKKLPFEIKSPDFESMMDIVKNHYNDVYDFDVYLPSIDKNLQRPLCWTLHQKQSLVWSVLKGSNIPPISAIIYKAKPGANEQRVIQIIDGKQRMNALISFMRGEFWLMLDNDEHVYFDDLDNDAQIVLNMFTFNARVAYEYDHKPISDRAKLDWFEQINFAGTPQDQTHIDDLFKSINNVKA